MIYDISYNIDIYHILRSHPFQAQTLVNDLRPQNYQYCMDPSIDAVKVLSPGYNYQRLLNNAQNYEYFQFNAPNFNNDIHIGFSNGFTAHNDTKWEIVVGGWSGTKHVIREGNQYPIEGLVQKANADRYISIELRIAYSMLL